VACVRKFKDETVAIMKKRLPMATDDALRIDRDGTLATMTKDGTMTLEAGARELAIRGELLNVRPELVPAAEKIFDFSIVRMANREFEAEIGDPLVRFSARRLMLACLPNAAPRCTLNHIREAGQ
jgi:hypothetical protein